MFNRWMPKEEDFYSLLEQASDFSIQGASRLCELLEDYTDVELKLQEMKNLEHACDRIVHMTIERLNSTFITPFDREDVHGLIVAVDDVLDATECAAQRMFMYRIKVPTEDAKSMAQIIHKQTLRLHKALQAMRDIRNHNEIMVHCIDVHHLENEADLIMKRAIGRLFDEEKDAIEIIRMRELYENLEDVSDCCEDVANRIQGVVVKMT